jgi:hypothetical protein
MRSTEILSLWCLYVGVTTITNLDLSYDPSQLLKPIGYLAAASLPYLLFSSIRLLVHLFFHFDCHCQFETGPRLTKARWYVF